jgi:hypothetical protein
MARIEITDLKEDLSISEDELKHVKGGIGLLLPAVQKIREASIIAIHKDLVSLDGTSYER